MRRLCDAEWDGPGLGREVEDADDIQGAALADASAFRDAAPGSIAPSAYDEHPISAGRR